MHSSFKNLKKGIPFLLFSTIIVTVLGLGSSCEPQDEIVSTEESIQLNFSVDTVFFDTVFTTLGSVTKRLSVRNPSKNAVNISNIRVGNGDLSAYSLIVNGVESNALEDIRLLGEDSLLILAKVQIDPMEESLPFIVQDSIIFETNGNIQDVKLVSWGQDARFFRGGLQRLPCDAVWDSNQPYVIYDSLFVPADCQLTIGAGTQIHLNPEAALFVAGSLNVRGSVESPVVFQGVRLEERYDKVAGQWNGIYFLEGSQGNEIEHATIKNATFGLYLGTPDDNDIPDVTVSYSVIQNMSFAGVQCFSADLYMYNSVVSNCARYTVAALAGGNYTFHHNTFLNYQFDFLRDEPSNVFSDVFEATATDIFQEDLRLEMVNNIVWGSLEDELLFAPSGNNMFEATLSHNLIRTQNQDFNVNDNILNIDPEIQGVPSEQLFALDTLSPAKDAGIPIVGIEDDLERKPRDSQPDIGALERKE